MSQVTELLVRIRQQGDDQLVKLQNTFKTLGQQTAAANVNFKELAQELKKVQAGSAQSINNLKGYASAWREIANSVDTTSDEFRIARQEADALDAKLNGFQNNQRAVATNFRNIASAANQAAAAMRTTTGLLRDPLTGAYRGVAGTTQYGAPIGPVMPPDYAGRIAQQQREADAQARRDARRRQIMEQRAAYAGEILGTRDPRTGALIAGGTGQFRAVGTQYAQPIGPALPPAARRRLGLGQIAGTAGTISAAGVFGGIEGLLGAGIGAAFGGPLGAATGGAIGAQVGMARQALGGAATYAAEIAKQRQALQLVTKDTGEYRRALQFIDKTSRDLAIPQEILTRQFTQLTASVKGAGGNVKDAEKAFIGIASGIRGTGGSLQQLDSALTATSQVFSKGKVSAEELRQQIGERLPGAFSLFAQSMGKTPQELDKALENGQVSLQDFQKFAEKLFAEYGENAKIIADGPDAAGDRLRTSLSRLNESIGSLLKPIGAAFQNTFAAIIGAIDAAVRKLNEFFGLGRGRQGQINDLQKILNVTDQRIQAFEKLGGKGGTGLGVIEKGQYDVLVKRRTETFAQLSALRAAEKAAATGTGEPPKGLPGIDTAQKTKTTKIPVQRLADLTAKSEQALLLSGKQLRIEELITQAKSKGYKYDEQILPLLGNIIQSNTKINLAQEHRDDLLKNENQLRKQGMSHEEFSARLNAANDAIQTQRNLRKAAFLQFQRKEADIAKQIYEGEIDARHEINILIADAQLKTKILGDEDLRRVEINRLLAQTIEKFAGILSSEELLEAIRKLREALEGTAKTAQNFKDNFKASFKAVADSALNLGANLGASLGNTFVGLADQIAEFVATGKASFADFTRSVLLDLSKIFIRAAMFQTLKALFPGSSAIGSFLGFANGGIMTANGPLELKRYAAGGIASSPQLAMFGEGSRPEAYVPLPDGRTIPVTMKNGAGGVSVNVNVDASGSSVDGNGQQANQLGKVIGLAVQQELIKQKRPGGLLA